MIERNISVKNMTAIAVIPQEEDPISKNDNTQIEGTCG
jgi:hypothetical protein